MIEASGRSSSLGDLCDRITVGHVGPMADQYVSSGVPFLRSQDIGEFFIDVSGVKFISPIFDNKLRKSRLRAGDITVVRTGYPGTAAVVPPELHGANCADLVIITPGNSLDSWYVASLLNSAWGKGHVAGLLVGVAQQHFNFGAARLLKREFPDINIQKRIGSLIKSYCDLIAINQRRVVLLEEMARRTFEEWFVSFRYPGHEVVPLCKTGLAHAPQGWKPLRLSAWADEIREAVNPMSLDGETDYVGLEHLPRRSTTLVEWGRSAAISSSKLRFKDGDILFGKIRPYFHKVAYASFSGVSSTDAVVIRAKRRRCVPYILGLVSSDLFVAHAVKTSNGTKMPRADWKVLREFTLFEPPEPLLRTYCDMAKAWLDMAAVMSAQNTRLRAARDLLLPKLISGEIDVSRAERRFAEAAE